MVFAIEVLGTKVTLRVPHSFEKLCSNELQRIEEKFSRFKSDSVLSQLNQHVGEWQSIDSEFEVILIKAKELFEKTNGGFHIGLQKQLEEQGYDSSYSFKDANTKTQPIHSLPFELADSQVKLIVPIEIGGFGKGYAADRLATLLREQKQAQYIINMGGDILVGSEFEEVLLEHPGDSKKAIGKITLCENAIASSSSNRRTWAKGKHHILNAKSGEPQQSIKAVWVVSDSCMDADAFATTLHSLEFGEACKLATSLELDAVIVSAEGNVFSTNDFVEWF